MGTQGKMITLEEAASRLQTTPLNVLMHLKRGLLQGVELEEGGWEVDAESLAALQTQTGGVKAEGVCASGCSRKHSCGSSCG